MQPPALIGRHYRVLREIGRGGMGVVYQVIHSQTGKQFALKVLSLQGATKPETLSRFKREIRMPSHIGSEYVVKVFESDTAEELDGAPFYVMELLHGCDVRRLVEKKIRLSHADVVWLCRQIADCLDAAHKVGIVHRDLKPDKITPVEKWLSFFRRPSEKVAEVLVTHWLSAKNPKRRSKQDHQTWISG